MVWHCFSPTLKVSGFKVFRLVSERINYHTLRDIKSLCSVSRSTIPDAGV
jgi:hypothetical protein